MNRRQKRMMDKENRKESRRPKPSPRPSGTSTPTDPTEPVTSTGERKRVVAENGKVLIVDSIGNVFLEQENEEGEKQEFLLDVDEIQRPSIRDTMVFQLPIWCFKRSVGRVMGTSEAPEEEDQEVEPVDEVLQATATSKSGSSRKRNKRSQRS